MKKLIAAAAAAILCLDLAPLASVAQTVVGSTHSAFKYPLKVSSNRRYLVDQNNKPFMIVGDSGATYLATSDYENIRTYFATRAQQGFNTVGFFAICSNRLFATCRADAATFDGIKPFTTVLPGHSAPDYDISKPNEAYWKRIDSYVRLAAQFGLVVFFNPAETDGWYGVLSLNSTAQVRDYGTFLGNRYRNFPNVVWFMGNDFGFGALPTKVENDVLTPLAKAIKAADPNHLMTVELTFLISSACDDPVWCSIVDLNTSYTYAPAYGEDLYSYNRWPTKPSFLEETNYDEVSCGNNAGQAPTNQNMRFQEYWTMLSGMTGQLYGDDCVTPGTNNWLAHLSTTAVTQLGYLTELFNSVPWWNLVPDQRHAIVTAGYGTDDAQVTGSGADLPTLTKTLNADNYVTTAATPDGRLAMAYLPAGGTLTVAMQTFVGPVTAKWFDPTNNSFTAISGSPFPNSGSHNFTSPWKNSAGDADFVLVLTH
jgi:Protein of unknown function (DUF4038)/Putative collagen-binding domain of a collagenase